uniref:Uncharacterized protein n=1 Tax=Cyprinus carpio TaxID=7962 RepID=A0A8C1SI00_CYPCA
MSDSSSIDSMLDQINSCLDNIEERNEALNGKLHELLESNREARREFREQVIMVNYKYKSFRDATIQLVFS